MENPQNKSKNYLATLFMPDDAFDFKNKQLMGRRVAGSNMAKGIAENLKDNEQLNIYTNSQLAKKRLEELLHKVKPKSSKINITMNLLEKNIQTLFIQDPDIVKYNVLRAGSQSNSFSIVSKGYSSNISNGRKNGFSENLISIRVSDLIFI